MKKLLVLLVLMFMASPALADRNRHRLRRQTSRRHITRHKSSKPRIYRRNRQLYQRAPKRVCKIVYVIVRPKVNRQRHNIIRSQPVAPIHKTIYIGTRSDHRVYQSISRNKILSQCYQKVKRILLQCYQKVKRNVYKTIERKQ